MIQNIQNITLNHSTGHFIFRTGIIYCYASGIIRLHVHLYENQYNNFIHVLPYKRVKGSVYLAILQQRVIIRFSFAYSSNRIYAVQSICK